MRKSAVIGVFRTVVGAHEPLSRRANRTPWGAIGPAWMTARPWMPSSSSFVPVASGMP